MIYELKTSKFVGPIEKLLELIEAKQLEITEFNLAAVTADFLNYLKTIEKVEPRLLADFVVVASRLLLIKSRTILPYLEISQEEEAEIKDLEERIRFYQIFKAASRGIKNLWRDKPAIFTREFLSSAPAVFYPPSDLTADKLHFILTSILKDFDHFFLEAGKIKVVIINLEEKMTELLERVKESALKFKELIKTKSRAEIIALFLAVLHLLRNELIKVEQDGRFEEIHISGI